MLTVASALRDLSRVDLAGSWPAFEVEFVVMSGEGGLAQEARGLGLTVTHLGIERPTGGVSMVRTLGSVPAATRRYLKVARRVHLVDAWLAPAYTFAGILQPIARVPVLMAGRRNLLDVHRSRSRVRDAIAGLAMGQVKAVVANSQMAADDAIAVEHVPSTRVHVIRNAVIPVRASPETRQLFRARWCASSEDLVVGCVANLSPGKGHDMLLEVADRTRATHPDLRFVLVGDGQLRRSLEEAITQRHLEGRVILNGREDDARPAYQAFDIAVQSSDSEGLPNAILEAAAAGLPIVATDVGGTSEIITDDVDGLLVARRDVDALCDGIVSLVDDPARRMRLGAAAASRAGAFSPRSLGTETAGLYLRLLGRGPVTPGTRLAPSSRRRDVNTQPPEPTTPLSTIA